MVSPGREPMSPAERILADRLCAAITRLLAVRSLIDQVSLLESINAALEAPQREHARAATETEMITVH